MVLAWIAIIEEARRQPHIGVIHDDMLPGSPRAALGVFARSDSLCRPCLRRLARNATYARRFASTSPVHARSAAASQDLFKRQSFFTNDLWQTKNTADAQVISRSQLPPLGATQWKDAALPRGDSPSHDGGASHDALSTPTHDTSLPHRRRRRKDAIEPEQQHAIPLDASSRLASISSELPMSSFKQKFYTYLALTKPRLTFLIVLTTTSAFTLFPVAASPLFASIHLSPLTLLNLTTGTALASASANTLNMLFEPEHDAKMSRTRGRPLVRKLITPRSALAFAVATGFSGVGLLAAGVNPTCAFLGALNIFLYAFVYTPMKRFSIWNTWAGAVVGGIPPLMGWAAAAGQAISFKDSSWRDLLLDPVTSPGGWLCAALLFAWQFPHFNALSWTIRHEYAQAGYKMLASINPRKNGAVALRYSVAMVPICVGLSYVGVTSWAFVPLSSVANFWMIREAWRFYKHEGHKGSARGLFWASIWQLPIVLVLAMVTKQGLWERIFRGGLDEEDWEYATQEAEEHEPAEEPTREAVKA